MGSNLPYSTGCDTIQRACDTILRPTCCLQPNTKAKDVTSFDDAFHLFFDEQVMDTIVRSSPL